MYSISKLTICEIITVERSWTRRCYLSVLITDLLK